MKKYYTRACNFYFGEKSKKLVSQNKTLPLNGNNQISFDQIEIITRNSKKIIKIKNIQKLSGILRKKINKDLKNIIKKKNNFSKLNFKKIPNLMGILNMTPDSFSDGGQFNKKDKGFKHAIKLFRQGADIIDIGGESTRPGSKTVSVKKEWNRIEKTLSKINKKIPLSLDTQKAVIMEKGIKKGINLINDISGLNYDSQTLKILQKYKIPFVIHHIKGIPATMQKKPHYKKSRANINPQ